MAEEVVVKPVEQESFNLLISSSANTTLTVRQKVGMHSQLDLRV
jgi:hypothetical protein